MKEKMCKVKGPGPHFPEESIGKKPQKGSKK
jgi:hypothetical protein